MCQTLSEIAICQSVHAISHAQTIPYMRTDTHEHGWQAAAKAFALVLFAPASWLAADTQQSRPQAGSVDFPLALQVQPSLHVYDDSARFIQPRVVEVPIPVQNCLPMLQRESDRDGPELAPHDARRLERKLKVIRIPVDDGAEAAAQRADEDGGMYPRVFRPGQAKRVQARSRVQPMCSHDPEAYNIGDDGERVQRERHQKACNEKPRFGPHARASHAAYSLLARVNAYGVTP